MLVVSDLTSCLLLWVTRMAAAAAAAVLLLLLLCVGELMLMVSGLLHVVM